MEHSATHGKSLSPASTTLTAEEPFQMQNIKEEVLEGLATSSLATPSKRSSAEQEYPSPPLSTMKTRSSAPSKKRPAEDELSPSPNVIAPKTRLRIKIGNIRKGAVRKGQQQQSQDAAKTKVSQANKSGPSAVAAAAAAAAEEQYHLNDDDPLRPLDCKIKPKALWDEKSFHLDQYPRLVTTHVTYRYVKVRHPHTHVWEYVCFPIAPADDIEKSLHLGRATKRVKWTGAWAEQKLQREIAKYEAVKSFWLFNYSSVKWYPFFPGYENKEEFCVEVFADELRSPWACAWLREFLGDEVMDTMETLLSRSDNGRSEEEEAINDALLHQGRPDTLCLRLKRRASPV